MIWQRRRLRKTSLAFGNPYPEFCGKVQKMTMDKGEQKGLQQTLEERGFSVKGMRTKCSPVCPRENNNCCMARLLSKQYDFHARNAHQWVYFFPQVPLRAESDWNGKFNSYIVLFKLKFQHLVLGVGQVPIPPSSKEDFRRCKASCTRHTRLMPGWYHPEVHQSFLEIYYGCLLGSPVWQSGCMGSAQAKGPSHSFPKCHDTGCCHQPNLGT